MHVQIQTIVCVDLNRNGFILCRIAVDVVEMHFSQFFVSENYGRIFLPHQNWMNINAKRYTVCLAMLEVETTNAIRIYLYAEEQIYSSCAVMFVRFNLKGDQFCSSPNNRAWFHGWLFWMRRQMYLLTGYRFLLEVQEFEHSIERAKTNKTHQLINVPVICLRFLSNIIFIWWIFLVSFQARVLC